MFTCFEYSEADFELILFRFFSFLHPSRLSHLSFFFTEIESIKIESVKNHSFVNVRFLWPIFHWPMIICIAHSMHHKNVQSLSINASYKYYVRVKIRIRIAARHSSSVDVLYTYKDYAFLKKIKNCGMKLSLFYRL